jgi:hypothetical protein
MRVEVHDIPTCFWIDNRTRTLSDTGQILCLYLMSCAHWTHEDTDTVRVSIGEISDDLKRPREAVICAIAELTAASLLVWDLDASEAKLLTPLSLARHGSR